MRRKPQETADFRRKPQIFAETGFSHLLSPFWRAPNSGTTTRGPLREGIATILVVIATSGAASLLFWAPSLVLQPTIIERGEKTPPPRFQPY